MANLIFKEFANGIRDVKSGKFYSFITDTFVPGTGVLPQKPNIRYYVYGVTITLSSVVTDAGVSASLSALVYNQSRELASIIKTTLVVNQISQHFPVRVLLDREAVLSFAAADITSAVASVTYCEVDDFDG